jgi:ABC-2 type transport system permease protein
MNQRNSKGLLSYKNSLQRVFSVFFYQAIKARKTKVLFFLTFLPVVMAATIQFIYLFNPRGGFNGIYVFSNMIMTSYLQFLIPILALFFGTSVCSDELEGKTLTYLTTRPIPKSTIVLGKYAAYTSLVILMTCAGVVLSFVILTMNRLSHLARLEILLRDAAVLSLGLICYTSFFTFVGTILKKSIMFGLIFVFGWENVIQYFPGSTQRFAIVHYLKSLLPHASGRRFSFLLFRLEPSSPIASIGMLLFITFIFLVLAAFFFSYKEYIIGD